MSFGAAPEYGRSSQSLIHPALSSRLHRVGAPPARHRHSQDLTDDGGRPPVSSAPSAKEGVSVCRHPLHARLLESSQASCQVVRRASSLALRDDESTGAKNSDTSHGVRCLSTKSASRIVARRLASPAPSALRVSHPPSGFIPSRPRGSVSRHIRPQAFGPPEPFPPSQPLRLSTPSALLPSRSRLFPGPKPGASTRNCGFRALLRLSIRHPPDRSPTSRCSPGLSPLRGLPDTTAGPKSSPHALHLRKIGCARPVFCGLRPRV